MIMVETMPGQGGVYQNTLARCFAGYIRRGALLYFLAEAWQLAGIIVTVEV